jgi:hypothetical protein
MVTASGTLSLSLRATIEDTGLSTVRDDIVNTYSKDLTNGTADNQFDILYHDTRTLAASGTYDYDLVGTLLDKLGATVNCVEIIAVLVKNLETTAGIDLAVGNAAAAQWYSAGADTLRVTNLSGSSTLQYELVILARSA